MTTMNDEEKIQLLVRMLQHQFNGGGCVIALFPQSEEQWGMAVAMSQNTPTQVLEQLSDALVMGQFEMEDLDNQEAEQMEKDKDA